MLVPILNNKNKLSLSQLENGFLVLIDKPVDWTSFDVCKKIRNQVPFKKVGHAGTLDPFATGLLLVGVGKGTKMMGQYSNCSKKYAACVEFGKATDSFDLTGTVTEEKKEFSLSQDKIEETIKQFSGEIEQVPPMFSAKKVKGRALYSYARKGQEVERKPVKVNIYETTLKEWKTPELRLDIHVSKGTYIRAYAHDFGKAVNIPAHLKELRRTEIDGFKVEDSFSIDAFCAYWTEISN